MCVGKKEGVLLLLGVSLLVSPPAGNKEARIKKMTRQTSQGLMEDKLINKAYGSIASDTIDSTVCDTIILFFLRQPWDSSHNCQQRVHLRGTEG